MQFTQGQPVPLQTPEGRIRLFIAFVISLSTLLLIPTPLTVYPSISKKKVIDYLICNALILKK
jgi:hypothetical protein